MKIRQLGERESSFYSIKKQYDWDYYNNYRQRIKFASLFDPPSIDTSFIVVTHNSQNFISRTLDGIVDYCEKLRKKENYDWEIIVVDCNSSDHTKEIVLQKYNKISLRIRLCELSHNYGVGYAIKIGILQSRGKKIIISEINPNIKYEDTEFLENAYEKDENKVYCSCDYNNVNRNSFSSSFFRLIVNRLFKLSLEDVNNNMKLISRENCKKIINSLNDYGYCYGLELLMLCKMNNIEIKEVYVNCLDSRILPPSPSFISKLFEILIIKFCYLFKIW